MKNKPIRHKDSNTFKFQPFAERIANIDIDIFHRVGHSNEADDETSECFFHQAMENWSILNLTEGFDNFKKEIKAHTLVTLPQLILDKERVVEVLLKHLRLRNFLSLQPLLDLVVAVAKDLRKDFYQYYKPVLEVLISLLNTKNTEQLEWTFTCLAYILKFVWRPLLKDITTVFDTFLPLLSNSQPDYIHNFAASSFAFIARKVKDWPTFLSHVLKSVKNRKDGVDGCGKLFFEVVSGVAGQFHSCAETILPLFLESLSNAKFPQNILFEILEKVVENIVENIHPQKGQLWWDCLIGRLDSLLNNPEKSAKEIELVLRLLGQSIEYRNGKFLQNNSPVIKLIFDIFNCDLPDFVLQTATKIAILLLLAKNIKLTQEQASGITRKVLNLPQEQILLYFVSNVSEFSAFEALVLPTFLQHCVKTGLNNDSLKVLTELVLKKAPLSNCGINLPKWGKYPLDFRNQTIETKFLNHLNFSDFHNYVAALICVPHLNLTDVSQVTGILSENINKFLTQIETGQSNITNVLFLLNSTVECLIHLNEISYLSDNFDRIFDTLAPISSLLSLKTIDFLITVLKDRPHVINMATLRKITANLVSGFSSPHHEIRLVTAHLYSLFEDLPEFDLRHSSDPDTPKEKFQIFTICYKIESIESQVQTYRDQLQNLEKLNFDKPQMIMCLKTEFRTIPLRYLCGTLYINFKLLWEPVVQIIEGHAHGLEIGEFWEVFGAELRTVVGRVRDEGEKGEEFDAKWEVINELWKKSGEFKSGPDYANYRLLLWKALGLFPDIAEAKTRDVSDLLLDFIEKEYTKNNSAVATNWNIRQNTSQETETDEGLEDEKQETKPKKGKSNLQVLLTCLPVFTKIRSPKSIYREPELAKLYFDFLQHKNSQVQKLALDCIMTYKHKFLTPYKDHLYNLVDDKNFKNELAAFQIDKESGTIQEEHRDDLVPLIIRIVFSKMSTKTGLRTGGKSSGQLRRNLVLRFLAGCQDKEMLAFVKMAFQYYSKFLDDDPQVMVKGLESITLESYIPPKRLQSAINLLNVILDQFGGLMGNELLTFILQIVLIIGGVLKIAFGQIGNVHAGYLAILRTLRTGAIKLVERFFGQFERYQWTNKQINAIFHIFVWPYLDKLNVEGIHSPTTLLKLFVQWGSNPRYFSLLVKHEDGRQDQYVLPHVIRLLLNPKSHITVVNAIEEMVEKLLTLQADEEDLQLVIPVDNLLPVPQHILDRIKLDDKLNYGSCILLPFVSSILEKIQRRLDGKNKNLNQRVLFILSWISELVWEADISDTTLKLLLPLALKRCSTPIGEEIVVQLLTTISNLVGNVANPCAHLKQITPLFGEVSCASGRKILVKVLKICLKEFGPDLVDGLNAFDTKWLDQPDFQRRHDAFKEVHKAIDEGRIDLDLGVLLAYNCYYLLKSEKDLSMKENSTHCLKQLCPYLINKYPKQVDYILNDTIFNLVRNGMKSRNDDFRNDCILLLGHLAKECPDSHVVLRDLNKYTNKSDPEVDFFENITHLQLHRHARALLKFCSITKDLTNLPNIRTLTQFILPLASHYLCNEKYVGKNSVIDASIECLGTICRILPWHQYEGLLKFYLRKLGRSVEYQKQLVRVTVAILDAFHYDLSKAQAGEDVALTAPKPEVEDLGPETGLEHEDRGGDEEGEPQNEDVAPSEEKNQSEDLDEEPLLDDGDALKDEEEDADDNQSVKLCEKVTVLCKSTATRVTRSIQIVLLPQLHRSLAELTHYDTSHKVNRKKTSAEREEEDLLRVPISLALVKLLQRLPKAILEANLPGIFMKLCTFLKSHLESVRRVTRETLQKIMQTLGPDYLGLLLGEMTPLLNRGFQVHVLIFTIHAVLNCLKPMFEAYHIDKVLLTVLQLCQADLFGSLSEEKEVAKIAVKTSEAKSTKSFDTFQILAQYITDKCLMDLILPIKNVLQASHSYKTVYKAEECLRHVALGLVDNEFIEIKSLLIFAYGTASESIPELVAQTKPQLSDKEKQKKQRERVDCYIIPKAPTGRSGVRNVKSSLKTNAYLLVEFGLRLCYVLLKREKLKDEAFNPFLDPFIPVFLNCLTSKHVKLSTLTLQCLTWVMKYDLPSLKDKIATISSSIFEILHKYASAGLSKGDNFDLVVAAFKTMAVLVRDVKYHTIDKEQLKVLLLYAEQDMHDHDRQATAFNLLKAIIARKLVVPEIHEVMAKVAELSITSELSHVRVQARVVFHQYLLDYPLGHQVENHVSFYLNQMSYEMQYGRESAIEMISTLISSFPKKNLIKYSGTLFVTLGARLVNDEAPECRKQVSECLSSLLSRLGRKDCEALYDIVLLWLKDKKISHRRLAAQLCGIFVTVEKALFESRLPSLLPLVLKQFGLKEEEDEEAERIKDHHLFQLLQMLLKICNNCPNFFKREEIEDLSKHIQGLLGYPHDWVRLAAAQFLGFVLAQTEIEELARLVANGESGGSGYLTREPITAIKALTLDLCDQLQPGNIKADLAEQVIKNLVFVARVLQKVTSDKINLLWLVKRMRKIVNSEIVEGSGTVLRTEVFKWIAAVVTVLDLDTITPIVTHLLAPLVREMVTVEESNAPLRHLAKEVGTLLKKRIGVETYTQTLSQLQQNLSVKRAERKRSRTQLAVTDPESFAKKKIKRHEKKKEAKKRKLEQLKGAKRQFKRRKAVDLDPESEVM
ncbi:small subunit processome component 20 homolog [Tribolium castaneum]|uniref:Small subunit processome component 20 homolog-like Protein n=1 Tax=Tribolium castaneum TaxID=7070 RepID=D7EJF6_TRICA|nr:PREDICTED: small subunit processome component 20 homolog [Tribolium castaneum]EFA12725.1 Small subunit processome component 20 homolog-like Protein [Tribolium castaneum]|eukprot:XP_969008.2 PREDICTED: small subunit processome component 20 homolog [Tribolium castaneum]